MEKELESYFYLEKQIDKITELIVKLKEENKQLREQNEQLMIQIQSANNKKIFKTEYEDDNFDSAPVSGIFTKADADYVRRCVNNALLKLAQLRQVVMEEN
ncbi:hypothetical protein AMJ80_07620 [bacterium SM23_31]|nr:MAG: hypothetical protein AMJ80_07620 [bacterium SM23_31]